MGLLSQKRYLFIHFYYDEEEIIAIPCGESPRFGVVADINVCFSYPLPLTADRAKRMFDRVVKACYCMPVNDDMKRCPIELYAGLRSYRKVMERYRLIGLQYIPEKKEWRLSPTLRETVGYYPPDDMQIPISEKMSPSELLRAFEQAMEKSI